MSPKGKKPQKIDKTQLKASREGYRSKEIYILLAIDEAYSLFKAGQVVVDLGACPGGFSHYALEKVGSSGRVIGLDKREIFTPIPNLEYIVGDFHEELVYTQLLETLGDDRPDIILSDIEPRITGNRETDQARRMYYAELALELAKTHLNEGGALVARVSKGTGFDEYLKTIRSLFRQVSIQDPVEVNQDKKREASLIRYVIALNFGG